MSFSLFDKNPFHGLSYWGAYIINEFFPIFKTIVPCQLSFFKSLQKNSAKCVAFFLFMCLLIYKEKSSCDLVTTVAAFPFIVAAFPSVHFPRALYERTLLPNTPPENSPEISASA